MFKKWWVLASVACGTFMATLDSSIVNIALPTLTKDLHVDLFAIRWVVISYLFMITCLLLPFGRMSDEVGRRRVFVAGYVVFVTGSALCGFSTSLSQLVISRAIQGLGASMLMVNGPAIITAAFPSKQRGSALGILAMVVSAGLISGPSIGGFMISELGWRSIFFVNLPIGILGATLVLKHVPVDLLIRQRAPFDWAGAFLQTVLLVSILMLVDPPHFVIGGELLIPSRWSLALVSALFGGAFIFVESRARAPLFDLSLMKDRAFWTANLASFLVSIAFSSVTVLYPFFLEEVMGFPPHQAGLFMTAIPVTIFIVAPVSGRLSDRLGGQELTVAGSLTLGVALMLMSGVLGPGLHPAMSYLGIIGSLACMGLSIGLFQSPNNNFIMSAVPIAKLGVASALLATIRNLGLVFGTGMATGLFSWRRIATGGDSISALHITFMINAAFAILAILAALGRPRSAVPVATSVTGEN